MNVARGGESEPPSPPSPDSTDRGVPGGDRDMEAGAAAVAVSMVGIGGDFERLPVPALLLLDVAVWMR